jgi:hypothetical protein
MTIYETLPNETSYPETIHYFQEPASKRQRVDHGDFQNSSVDAGTLLMPLGERNQFYPITNLDAPDIPDELWSGFLDDSNHASSAWLNGNSQFNAGFDTEDTSRALDYGQSMDSNLQGSLLDESAFHDWQPQVSATEPSAGHASPVETAMPEEIVPKDVCFGMVSLSSNRMPAPKRVLLGVKLTPIRYLTYRYRQLNQVF